MSVEWATSTIVLLRLCLLLVGAPLAFALADVVTEAELNAGGGFYFGFGLRGNPLELGWTVYPCREVGGRCRVEELESKAELTSDGNKHPCCHRP